MTMMHSCFTYPYYHRYSNVGDTYIIYSTILLLVLLYTHHEKRKNSEYCTVQGPVVLAPRTEKRTFLCIYSVLLSAMENREKLF